jgi:hypothetical protein
VTASPNDRPLWDPTAGQDLAWTHDFGTELRLNGGRAVRDEVTGETVLLLGWEALRPTEDWSVSVRLLEGGIEIAQADSEHPVMGAYPTSRWAPGEVVGDAYAFPAELAGQADAARIILYRQGSGGSFEDLDEAVKTLP